MTKCILCKGKVEGFGHNPQPLAKNSKGVCCTDCNNTKVIPARLKNPNW